MWLCIQFASEAFKNSKLSKNNDKKGGSVFQKVERLWSKRWCFGEISLMWILSVYCALSCLKVWKNPYSRFWELSLNNFGSWSHQNCPFGPKKDFLVNLTSVINIYLFHSVKLQDCIKFWKSGFFLQWILRYKLA